MIGFFSNTLAATLLLSLAAAGQAAAAQAPAKKSAQAAPAAASLVNVQIVEIDVANSVIRLQATGPLAFDRLKSKDSRQVIVQLYAAQLGDIPPFEQPTFGSVSFADDGRGTVTVTVNLSSSRSTAKVTQGGNPNTVEVRVNHHQ